MLLLIPRYSVCPVWDLDSFNLKFYPLFSYTTSYIKLCLSPCNCGPNRSNSQFSPTELWALIKHRRRSVEHSVAFYSEERTTSEGGIWVVQFDEWESDVWYADIRRLWYSRRPALMSRFEETKGRKIKYLTNSGFCIDSGYGKKTSKTPVYSLLNVKTN